MCGCEEHRRPAEEIRRELHTLGYQPQTNRDRRRLPCCAPCTPTPPLVNGDAANVVLVELGEGCEQMHLALQLVHVHGGGDELVVVNGAAVDISDVHELCP